MSELTNEILMDKFQSGDISAFDVLLERHKNKIFNYIYRFFGDYHMSEDIFQEVFLRVIKHKNTYRHHARFTTWIMTITRNLCIDTLRKKKIRYTISLNADREHDEGQKDCLLNHISDPTPTALEQIQHEERQEILAEAVLSLEKKQREVFLMRQDQELTFEEIACIQNCPVSTVKSRMRYAFASIRSFLEDKKLLSKGEL